MLAIESDENNEREGGVERSLAHLGLVIIPGGTVLTPAIVSRHLLSFLLGRLERC